MLMVGSLAGSHRLGLPLVGCTKDLCPSSTASSQNSDGPSRPFGRQLAGNEDDRGEIGPRDARVINDATPYVAGPIVSARPFKFSGSSADRTNAIQCLAAAQLYEAGWNESDQKAVAQVILNRVRHPAYPHSICAVVFEGASCSTGCQFTFTCDGSLSRRYPALAWATARKLASRMLDGEVDRRVGWATHYHTDWVHPYWSSSLEKLSSVRSHLFFRWRGYWGTGPAFSAQYSGREVGMTALLPFQGEHGITELSTAEPGEVEMTGAQRPDAPLPLEFEKAGLRGTSLKLVHPDGGSYGLLIRKGTIKTDLVAIALGLCAGRELCRVTAWDNVTDIPLGFPISPQAQKAARFFYFYDAQMQRKQFGYNCALFPKESREDCI